ncbi:serine hydrolase [Inquilinus limosus]|uniref:serine hydrolase n=1 Tax=Inquilinus limosus TaxID=171674 RepID=UPI001376B245|nr:serine hydrolase [Inquilinus limosus]
MINRQPGASGVPSAAPVTPAGTTRRRIAVATLALLALAVAGPAARAAEGETPMDMRIQALQPELASYVTAGMKAFDTPGLAIGIVSGDRLVYARGFGVRSKTKGGEVGTRTVFQIGSTTKAFLAATLAIAVDRGRLRWDDRIVDLDPEFRLKDPWVTREFRVFDLLAQRSGLPPYANDSLGILGLDEAALIQSLRNVEPVSSFRSTFAYTNITHLLAGRIVARGEGAADWNAVLRQDLLEPLGMAETSTTAEAIEAAPDHTQGHRWTPDGTVEVPFTPIFPYAFGGAGDMNSTIEDMARWLRLQLRDGSFDGRRIVSAEAMAATRTPRVEITDKVFYAMGWVGVLTPNGRVIWHNGGTPSFGAYVGFVPERDVGVVVLTNEENVGFPDAVGAWVLDRLLDNPRVDHAAAALDAAKARYAEAAKAFVRPEHPQPALPLASLAGGYAEPSLGKAVLRPDGDGAVLELQEGGAALRLEPWDGSVFIIRQQPVGRFAAIVENSGPSPSGFAQFQIDTNGTTPLLRLTIENQSYVFRRE